MIIDTDVIIWYLRGNTKARKIIDNSIPFSISAITYMELIQGMKSKAELQTFFSQIKDWNIEIYYITEDITSRAIYYIEEFFLSHNMKLSDALIGATAIRNNDILITANIKHYKHLPNIQLKAFRL